VGFVWFAVADRREHYYILRGTANQVTAGRASRPGVLAVTRAPLDSQLTGGPLVPRLLVVHHTTSPALEAMLQAAVSGARDPELGGIEVALSPALTASAPEVLAADGFLLGTPANIGYMSGALKHFFDQVYYPCLHAKKGAPYGLYVHGASDTTGAVRAVAAITAGLGWAEVAVPVVATGPVGKEVERLCYDLAATVAANLL
jgi:hypothetical protein